MPLVLGLLSLFLVGSSAVADGQVRYNNEVKKIAVDPVVELGVRYLLGEGVRSGGRDRQQTSEVHKPVWLLVWRRAMRASLQGLGAGPLSADGLPLGGAVVLELDLRAGGQGFGVSRRRAWSSLGCRAGQASRASSSLSSARSLPSSPVLSTLRVAPLWVSPEGDYLLSVDLECAEGSGRRRSRLLMRTDSQGAVSGAWGLSLRLSRSRPLSPSNTRRAELRQLSPWPVGPAPLRSRFGWLLQLPENTWIAQVAVKREAGRARRLRTQKKGGASLSALPGPVVLASDRPPALTRVILSLDARGVPASRLLSGAVAVSLDSSLSSKRKRRGLGLPSPLVGAPPLAPLAGVGLWEVRRSRGVRWLIQQVAARGRSLSGARVYTAATVLAWQVDRRGRVKPLTVKLPRTSGEGIWACDVDLQGGDALICVFDSGGLPGARGFRTQRLRLGAGGLLQAAERR